MRHLLFFITSITILTSCKPKGDAATQQTSYTINGHIKGLQPGDIVILEHAGDENKFDTAAVKGEVFEFKGQANEPLLGYISITDGVSKNYGGIELVIENAIINIDASKDALQLATVQGGRGNADLKTMSAGLKVYNDSLKMISDKADALPKNDVAGFKNLEQGYYSMVSERRKAIQQFATDHPASIVSAFYIYQDLAGNIDDKMLDTFYSKFDEPVKNSVYGKKINELLTATKRVEIGNAAPELNLNDENDKPVLLSSYKGKILLVDFWASWCAPCRAENPNVVRAYNQFKDKGFDVLGVSLDKDKDAWQQAIRNDNLTWKHVSDLKQWESSAVKLYGLSSIPSNVLVDKDGKIIAKNLTGDNLIAALNQRLN